MPRVTPRYSKEEFKERGDRIYEEKIQSLLSPEDKGKLVAIDIETGEYEIDDDEMTAGDRLRARLPQSQIWMVRVGYRYVHRFGWRGGAKRS